MEILLRKIKLGAKIALGFTLITLILGGVLLFNFFSIGKISALDVSADLLSRQVDTAGRVQANILSCRISYKNLLLRKDFTEQAVFQKRYDAATGFMEEFISQSQNNGDTMKMVQIQKDFDLYRFEFSKVLQQKQDILQGNLTNSMKDSIAMMDQIGTKMSDSIERIKLSILDEKKVVSAEFDRLIYSVDAATLAGIIAGSVFAILIGVFFTRLVLSPIRVLTSTFRSISEGDKNTDARLPINSSDEIGVMSGYFNQFMQRLGQVYHTMQKQHIINTIQAKIDDITRGEKSVVDISPQIVTEVCQFTKAPMGTMFVVDDHGEFVFRGGFAERQRQLQQSQQNHGKVGMFAQAISDHEIKVLHDLPQDYFKIQSALGEAMPKEVTIIPCVANGAVVCVLELATFSSISYDELEVLNRIAPVIAIGVHAAITRERINDLYQKTLQQTEELQVQQEELMQSHEELTEQTNALIEKENQLQVQQEELRVTNVELENRNDDLEKQKQEMILQNQDLELAQQELLDKTHALEMSNQYRNEFFANVSHELKTPLNSILVLSELLMNKDEMQPLSEKEMGYAQTIHHSGSELLTLITEILDMARVEAGKIDVHQDQVILDDVCEYVQNSFNELATGMKIDFFVINEAKTNHILTDDFRLKQIIKNLLSNAFKFTEKGSVGFKIIEDADGGDNISFIVSDTGIGIAPEQHKVIFEPFKQANGQINRKYGGTGLGLSISKQLAYLLGGDILLQSTPGQGSTFTLTLPKDFKPGTDKNLSSHWTSQKINSIPASGKTHTTIKPDQKTSQKATPTSSRKVSTILIVEDDEIFANFLRDDALEKGFEVYLASDGKTGLALAQERIPDAILLDIGLPDMNGKEVLNALEANASTQNIPVHVISGFDQLEIMDSKSVVSFLKKPVSIHQVEKIFNELSTINILSLKNVLLVGKMDDEVQEILTQRQGVSIDRASTAQQALEMMPQKRFDCIIVDRQLENQTCDSFLKDMHLKGYLTMPIIIYSDQEITPEEEAALAKLSDSIIIRGAKSLARLGSEVDIFLYNLKNTPTKKKVPKTASKAPEIDDLSGKKVLIVDDDIRNIFSISGILEGKGISVVVARNGQEGIDKFTENSEIDLILMDIMMPIIDGYDTIREIRSRPHGKDVPIIVVTAKSMPEDRNKCIEAGADDYTTKPVEVDKLISLLRVWLH